MPDQESPTGASPAPAELIRALAVLAEPPGDEHARVAEALGLGPLPETWEHSDLFVFQLHPFASVHLGAEGQLGGAVRDRVSGFWRAVGRTPPTEPDHLSALLGLYAGLVEAEHEADGAERVLIAQSRGALMHEHIGPWVPFFLDRVQETGGRFYGAWAGLLAEVLRHELVETAHGDTLPVHLREVPELPDPREQGADAFLTGLLAPGRSGLILTRTDLAALGRSLEISVRMGPRRSVLDHLLGEAPRAVLTALGASAAERASRHEAWGHALGAVASHWAHRARATASRLHGLADDAVAAGAAEGTA